MGNGVLAKDFAGDGNNAVVTSGIGASDSSKGTLSLWFNRPASASTDEFLYHRTRGSTAGIISSDYNGTTQSLLNSGPTGIVDSQKGILSFWVRFDNNAVVSLVSAGPNLGDGFTFLRRADGKLQIQGNDPTGQFAFAFRSTVVFFVSPIWRHVLVSWDLGANPGDPRLPGSTRGSGGTHNMYVDDVDVLDRTFASGFGSFGLAPFNRTVSYVGKTNRIAARGFDNGQKLNGCLSEVYWAPDQFLDFSVVANRRKFIDANGLPVGLGSDGSTPTSVAPITFAPDGNPFVNAGTGGNYTTGVQPGVCNTIPGVDESDGVKYVSVDNSVRVSLNSEPGTVSGTAATDYSNVTPNNYERGADLTSNADSKQGICSFWFFPVLTASEQIIYQSTDPSRVTPNKISWESVFGGFRFGFRRDTGAFGWTIASQLGGALTAGVWHHILVSWDMGGPIPISYFINDVLALGSHSFNPTATIAHTAAEHSIGDSVVGGNPLQSCISEFYLGYNQHLDFSSTPNRRKFIDGSGNPVDLGPTGALPTGTAPHIYLRDGDGAVNAGTGGAFTLFGPAPVPCPTSPGPDNKVVDISSMGGISTDVWHHLLASWDHTSFPLKSNLHIDNVFDIDVAGTGNRVGTIDHSALLQAIAGTQTGGASEYGGCLSEVYFSTEFIDTNILANRRLFIDAAGLPVELGSDGSLPLGGTPPIIYLPDGDPAVNAGTGGNFAQNGTIAACATAPNPVLPPRTIIEIVRDEIAAAVLVETDKFLIRRLGFAETFLTDALNFFDAGDFRKVAKGVRKAVKFLELAVEKGFDAATITDWGERLMGAIRSIATIEIDAAIARTGDPIKIAEAQDAFADGEIEKLFEEFLDAIRDYEKAIKSATVA